MAQNILLELLMKINTVFLQWLLETVLRLYPSGLIFAWLAWVIIDAEKDYSGAIYTPIAVGTTWYKLSCAKTLLLMQLFVILFLISLLFVAVTD